MALDAVVSRSFVVIRADRSASEALSELETASAEAVLVERPIDDRTAWYLFPVEQARAMLGRAPDASVVDALGLHEWTAAPTLDADADPSAARSGAIVLRAGRPIGFIDPRGPTATAVDGGEPVAANGGPQPKPTTRGWHPGPPTTTTPPRTRRGGQRAKPPTPAEPGAATGAEPGDTAEQQRSVEAAFPGTVKADAVEWLLVTIVNQAPTATGLGIDVAVGETVDILVQPRRGFEVVGDAHGSLEVPASGESLPLQFKLRAVDVGKGIIRVVVFSQGEPLGVITLEPTVEPAAAAATRATRAGPRQRRPSSRPRLSWRRARGSPTSRCSSMSTSPAASSNSRSSSARRIRRSTST